MRNLLRALWIIGHVQLQTGAIVPAEAFYAAVLGFDITYRYRCVSFYGAGGWHRFGLTACRFAIPRIIQ